MFYIAQYPVRWTAQSALQFSSPGRPVHSDTNSPSLVSILAMQQLRKDYSLTFGCAEWYEKTRPGMNTSEEQQEWRRLPKRSPREDWSGTGMWWGEMANTYWGKCWGQIYQGKGKEDDRKQDGKTRVNEGWKVLDWERARRRTGRCGEERLSVIPATLHDGKNQRKS